MVLALVIKYDAKMMAESDHSLRYKYVLVLRGQDKMSGTVFPCSRHPGFFTKHHKLCCLFKFSHFEKRLVNQFNNNM